MAARQSSAKQPGSGGQSDPGISFNKFKEYEGRRYTGMPVGRSHKWHYDRGDWKETRHDHVSAWRNCRPREAV